MTRPGHCRECLRPWSPKVRHEAKGLCHRCYRADWYRRNKAALPPKRKAPSPDADYPSERLAWSLETARAAYDATPAAAWAMLFWDAVSVRLGRSGPAAHRQLRFRWGWPAKVDPKLRKASK